MKFNEIELTSIDKEKNLKEPQYEINHSYLVRFSLVLALSASIQSGIALSENGQIGYILAEKLGWEKTDITKCTLLGPVGIALGSVMGGVIGPKVGIFRLLIAANGIAVFSNLIKVI